MESAVFKKNTDFYHKQALEIYYICRSLEFESFKLSLFFFFVHILKSESVLTLFDTEN